MRYLSSTESPHLGWLALKSIHRVKIIYHQIVLENLL